MGRNSARTEATESHDPMAEFANHIIERLELGIEPWGQAGNSGLCAGSQGRLTPQLAIGIPE